MIIYHYLPKTNHETQRELRGSWVININDWESFKTRVEPGDVLFLDTLEDIYPLFFNLSDFFRLIVEKKIGLVIVDARKENYHFSSNDLKENFQQFIEAVADMFKYIEHHPRERTPTIKIRDTSPGRPPKTKELEKVHRLVQAWKKAGEKPNIKELCKQVGVTRQAYYNYIKNK